MAGLNLEFAPNSYSLLTEKSDGVRYRRIYRVQIGPETGDLFLRTVEDAQGPTPEQFAGFYASQEEAENPRENPSLQMGGYVGAHQRDDGVLSIGTPWRAASLKLMRLAKEAAEAENARLIVDEDSGGELEDEERKRLYNILRDLLPEAKVGVVEENGRLNTYFPHGRWDANGRAAKIEQLLREKTDQAFIPNGSPALGASSWEDCWEQHFLSAMRVADTLEEAAESATYMWHQQRRVRKAQLDELLEDIRWEIRYGEDLYRTGAFSFEIEGDSKVTGKVANGKLVTSSGDFSADVHGIRELVKEIR